MSKLEKAYLTIQRMELRSSVNPPVIDPRILLITSVVYLVTMLSVPLGRLSMLIWFSLIPIVTAQWLGLGFGRIFIKSLFILPFVILIAIFNPIIDRAPAFVAGGLVITRGWLTFLSVILRGLLAVQMLIVLTEACGFNGICRTMHKLGIPSFLTDQLMFVYRYISVLLSEAIAMRRAREARGFGRKSYPLKLWGVMIGQLFLRAIDRSERINKAMLARGFNGYIPAYGDEEKHSGMESRLYLLIMVVSIACMRIFDLSYIITQNVAI